MKRPNCVSINRHASLRRRIAAPLIAVALAGSGLIGTASAASAAIPECRIDGLITIGASTFEMYAVLRPRNLDGNDYCYMHQGLLDPYPPGGPVRALQLSLNYCYGKSLVVDGSFGPATAAALRSVQSAEGIAVDGSYGPQTRDNMKWRVDGHDWCWEKY